MDDGWFWWFGSERSCWPLLLIASLLQYSIQIKKNINFVSSLFRFKTNAILRRHARIHQNFKAYCCDICGHRTLDKCALKLHIVRYHTDESPFPCHICGKKFYSARTMKVKKWLKNADSIHLICYFFLLNIIRLIKKICTSIRNHMPVINAIIELLIKMLYR